IQDGVVLRFSMAADDKEFIPLPLASEKSYQRSTDDDQREWDAEKKYRYKCCSRQRPHHFVFQCSAPDAENGGSNDREHGRLETVKDRCKPGEHLRGTNN